MDPEDFTPICPWCHHAKDVEFLRVVARGWGQYRCTRCRVVWDALL